MKKLILLMIAAAGSAYADAPLFTSPATLASLSGEQIYDHICQGCHMAGGQGAVGAGFYPKLAANKNFVSWQFVAVTVLKGRNGMPPFGYPANDGVKSRANALERCANRRCGQLCTQPLWQFVQG